MAEIINNLLVKQLQIREGFLTCENGRLLLNGKPVSFQDEVVNLIGDQQILGEKEFQNASILGGKIKIQALDSELRVLIDSDNEAKIDWGNSILFSNGLAVLDWSDGVLRAGEDVVDLEVTLDWKNRELTGNWITSYPTEPDHVATKQYVDDRVQEISDSPLTVIEERIVMDQDIIKGYLELEHHPIGKVSVLYEGISLHGTEHQENLSIEPHYYIETDTDPARLVWNKTWGVHIGEFPLGQLIEEGDRMVISYNRGIGGEEP